MCGHEVAQVVTNTANRMSLKVKLFLHSYGAHEIVLYSKYRFCKGHRRYFSPFE